MPVNGDGMTPYDGFGAYIPAHYPHVKHYPGNLESPAEITVTCSCEQWEYFSQASAGGGCDTNYHDAYEEHVKAMEGNDDE